jgi:hypothetical protein
MWIFLALIAYYFNVIIPGDSGTGGSNRQMAYCTCVLGK